MGSRFCTRSECDGLGEMFEHVEDLFLLLMPVLFLAHAPSFHKGF